MRRALNLPFPLSLRKVWSSLVLASAEAMAPQCLGRKLSNLYELKETQCEAFASLPSCLRACVPEQSKAVPESQALRLCHINSHF
jgi:hypothetical protein|uniref:Uncharacterized protein n=1 Tax=Mus musculus TaxID=10090 RepID=Q3UQB6_MOUSE|nr:unnamed protein product [Mus musculus]